LKKYGLILLLLLTVSTVFNYNLSNKLKASITLSETLEVAILESDINNDALELEVSSLTEDITKINKELQDKTETIKFIDDKLEADGEILVRIDALLLENNKFEKELNAASLELNTLKEENSKKIEGVLLTEAQIEKWDKDIQDILELLDVRISILEEGISSLSTFSIERIMVKQEIDFLKTIHANVEKLETDIQDIN